MAIEGIYFKETQKTTSSVIQGKNASELDMNDFMNLLVAQMTNQDMLNPTNDTEFIAQMAQFSSLQGINTLQEYQLSSYAASYTGKYVTIANQTPSGTLETITGWVESVNFYDGTPKVQVNGKNYDLYTVMEVSDSASSGTLGEASQYIGKTVTVTYKNDMDEDRELTGRVTGVTVKDDVPHIIINGTEYPVSAIKGVDGEETDTDQVTKSEAAAQGQTLTTRYREINDMDNPEAYDRSEKSAQSSAESTITTHEAQVQARRFSQSV